MAAKGQFKVTLPEDLINRVDYYRKQNPKRDLSRAQFTEFALEAYIKFLHGDYSGDDRVINLLNQLIEENKLLQDLIKVNTEVTKDGLSTMYNLQEDIKDTD